MTDFAIKTIQLGKSYPIRKDKGFGTSVSGMIQRAKSDNKTKKSDSFRALHDINFEISAGESIGIIGRNGAGKSTLLKLISEITRPTHGEIYIQGKVASVLDVGVGFHPDLTGRENIFHTGILLGMKKKEINEKIQKIIDFSEIERSIDLPVKQYSSGMYVRLAFSIAIHIDAEILIFDEVLTVGDAVFRIKAIEAIKNYIKLRKSTVLIVSHNLSEIADLCDKTMWLNHGEIMQFGPTTQVISAYIEHILQPNTDIQINSSISNEKIIIKNVTVTAEKKSLLEHITTEDELTITILFDKISEENIFDLGYTLTDNIGNRVYFSSSAFESIQNNTNEKGSYKAITTIPKHFLNAGSFMLNLLIIENKSNILVRLTNAAVFRVEMHPDDPSKLWKNVLPGPLKPTMFWEITKEAN